MKIKEVTEKTELTERAVRLYVENGLVAPSVNESYSGRRNIEFSDEDVKRLKSISVLRKAGFSIAQIKLLMHQPEKSKDVLREFIDETTAKIESDKEIVSCLIPLLDVEKLDPELISRSLEKPVVEEKSIPAEDSEPTALQLFIRKLFLIAGSLTAAFGLLCNVPIIWVEIRDIREYKFPAYDATGIFYMAVFLAPVLLSLLVFFIGRKKYITTKKNQRIKNIASVGLLCVIVWSSFFTYCGAYFAGVSNPEGFVVSSTRNTENYMELDAVKARESLLEFLPEELPDVKGVKYKYWYKTFGGAPMDPQTEIFLEIPMDEEAFSKTVEKYKAFRPSDSVCEPYEAKVNDWTVIYYRGEYERAPTNYEPIFAFNEKACKIRLICEYGNVAVKGAGKHSIELSDKYKW